PPDELGGPGPGQLLGDHEVLGRAEAAAAELLRPGDAHPALGGELPLPLTAEGHLGVEVGGARRQPDAVLPRQVVRQPAAQLLAEPVLLGGRPQVHGRPAWHSPAARPRPSRPAVPAGTPLVDCPPVDFDLSPDQRDLRDAAGAVLDRYASPERVRAIVDLPDGGTAGPALDRELWAVLADQGWLAIEQPEEEGGLGLGLVEVGILAEQLGRHVAPVPFFGTNLAQHVLLGTSR